MPKPAPLKLKTATHPRNKPSRNPQPHTPNPKTDNISRQHSSPPHPHPERRPPRKEHDKVPRPMDAARRRRSHRAKRPPLPPRQPRRPGKTPPPRHNPRDRPPNRPHARGPRRRQAPRPPRRHTNPRPAKDLLQMRATRVRNDRIAPFFPLAQNPPSYPSKQASKPANSRARARAVQPPGERLRVLRVLQAHGALDRRLRAETGGGSEAEGP